MSANWIIALVNRMILIFFIASLAILLVKWKTLPPEVPIFYSRPWGADQLGNPLWLFLLPLGSLIWYAVNVVIATSITREYLIFTQTLALTSLVVSVLSFITLCNILFLVS